MTTTPSALPKEQAMTRANGQVLAPSRPPSPAEPVPASPSGLDLVSLSDDALAALVEGAQAEIVRRKNKKEADFLALVADTARTLGLTPARVAAAISGNSHRSRTLAENDGRYNVKRPYRDPATGATWSGRGQAPAWIEFGSDTLPPKKPGDDPRRLPLRKFWIAEQEK